MCATPTSSMRIRSPRFMRKRKSAALIATVPAWPIVQTKTTLLLRISSIDELRWIVPAWVVTLTTRKEEYRQQDPFQKIRSAPIATGNIESNGYLFQIALCQLVPQKFESLINAVDKREEFAVPWADGPPFLKCIEVQHFFPIL